MLLRTFCVLHRVISLEVGIFFTIKLPLLAFPIVNDYVNRLSDCESYLHYWSINDSISLNITFCTESLGCRTFDWDQRAGVRIIMISTYCQGVATILYFLALVGVVWHQMTVDAFELTGIYYFWRE